MSILSWERMMVEAKEQLNNFNNPLIKIQQRKGVAVVNFSLYIINLYNHEYITCIKKVT